MMLRFHYGSTEVRRHGLRAVGSLVGCARDKMDGRDVRRPFTVRAISSARGAVGPSRFGKRTIAKVPKPAPKKFSGHHSHGLGRAGRLAPPCHRLARSGREAAIPLQRRQRTSRQIFFLCGGSRRASSRRAAAAQEAAAVAAAKQPPIIFLSDGSRSRRAAAAR